MTGGTGRVLLYRGAGLVATLIQWQTRSVYCHAALLHPDGRTVIESMQGIGVRLRSFQDRDWADVFEVAGVSGAEWQRAWEFAEGELGCGYDYRSVLRFISRRTAGAEKRWFCSELVFAALEQVGCRLLERTHSWAVAPGHLAWSPLLIPQRPPVQQTTVVYE